MPAATASFLTALGVVLGSAILASLLLDALLPRGLGDPGTSAGRRRGAMPAHDPEGPDRPAGNDATAG